jgi:hypothetical protein
MSSSLSNRAVVAGSAVALLFWVAAVRALDLEITDLVCDKELAVTAFVDLRCSGGGRCTFGEDAVIYGTCKWEPAC